MKRLLQALFCLLALIWSSVELCAQAEIVANPSNTSRIDSQKLHDLLTGRIKFWDDGPVVTIAVLKTDPGTDELLLKHTGMTASRFKNHWQRIAFSGRGRMPKLFSNVEELVAYVSANEGAIGIVSAADETQELRKLDMSRFLASEGIMLAHGPGLALGSSNRNRPAEQVYWKAQQSPELR